ncbi:class I adenylate-forming enzyme family protein [Rhizobium ruizarguesonis]|uniref:class I adenylate-forming enzyme family protein n=1 Tax=Rhizobium TaxID=379 RepID=UPI0013C14081|nr:long-chain-fatty-acid--CoA ligase [Rhizobium ruizarguesonis]MBY5828613.1 long-chain-fatty-acid--CoA ligase [Rhizobium leguminosarum]MBY5856350.1 long-chain-fatty-acid--CoA ligase [Rhizobium leguminosarum]NEI96509.1 long-chain-fatty-acid--CoA ligase [Rhizobium ruizarguesonis]NEJ33868.1 long-chain-fatty-acid--CoA ligase [Rhizobium ruizarguesonis]
MHVAHLVHRSAQRYPDRPLWLNMNGSISYRDGARRINQLSNALLAVGQQGDRVAILSANRFEAYEAYLAAMNAGMAAVPLNPKSHVSDHQYALDDSGARFVIFSPEYAEALGSVRSEVYGAEHWIAIGGSPSGTVDYETFLASGSPNLPDITIEPNALAWLFYTSGTTGKSKGAMETHRNLLTMVQQFRQTLLADTDEHDVMLHLAPIAHGTASVGLAHLAAGAAQTFPLSANFDPEKVFGLIQDLKVSASFLAPTMVQMLLQANAAHRYDLSSLKNIIYGGGPMYREVLKKAIETFGSVFSQIYGQGEAPMTCTGLHKSEHRLDDPQAFARLSSAGREMPGVMVRVVDEEGRGVATGTPGEVVVRSDLVMPGYWNRPDATADTLKNGWLHTGDVGYLDERGYLFITDRIKDMIISGGANIYPREVEEVMLQHKAVAEVCVIGVPDEQWGESVKAVIVLQPGQTASAEELIAFARENMASYKKPKSIDFVESLPKSAFGKVLKRELRQPYWAKSTRAV